MTTTERRKWDFTDLPPRVVIEIFSLITARLKGDYIKFVYRKECSRFPNNEEFEDHDDPLTENETSIDLFGYFKKDRLRNSWFYFPSVEYFKAKRISNFILSRSLRNLVLNVVNDRVVMNVAKESANMKNLVSLSISNIFLPGEEPKDYIEQLFSKQDSFPRLKRLEMDGPLTRYCKNWEDITNFKIWKKLEYFSFRNNRGQIIPTLKFFEKLENVKKLVLVGVEIEEKQVFTLPKLEHLRWIHSKNVWILGGEKLRTLILESVGKLQSHHNYYKELYRNCRNIEFLDLYDDFSTVSYMLDSLVNPLPNMKNIELYIDESVCQTKRANFGENVERIILFTHRNEILFNEYPLFTNNYQKLQELRLNNLELRVSGERKWPLGENVKRVKFVSLRNFNEMLFKINSFQKLESLELFDIQGVTGRAWNGNFGRLKYLSFGKLKDFDSFFFQEKCLCKLKKLRIVECLKLRMENWNLLEELEVFTFIGSEDQRSSETPFPEDCFYDFEVYE